MTAKNNPKRSASAAAAAAPTQGGRPCGTLIPPPNGVTVRMYRQGLGDCFLLAFGTGRPKEAFYMLVDCGVILGTRDPEEKMQRVVSNIQEATNGHIDALVITHEHWDHVSGFLQARTAFEKLQVHNVWLAWTENPEDELACRLRAESQNQLALLRRAVGRALNQSSLQSVTNLLEFFGMPATVAAPGALAAAGGGDTRQALNTAVAFCPARPQYHLPGSVVELPKSAGLSAAPSARVYILGPPHDEKTLRRINPTKKGKEVYTLASALTAQNAFLFALQNAAELSCGEQDLQDLSFPFDRAFRITRAEAKAEPFFKEHYGFEHYEPKVRARPTHPAAWRRIDDDWLGVAGQLALNLDSYTNNTSLTFAIELLPSGKVLLFAADAQVGNWLSWDNYTWNVRNGTGAPAEVKIAQLLKRTVLYKVGHHGSHNATIRGLGEVKMGLELIEDPALVAMLPVDHEMAAKKGWSEMPFEPLLQRLDEKCRRRVLRIDDAQPKPKPEGMIPSDWKEFQKSFCEDPLFFDFTIENGK